MLAFLARRADFLAILGALLTAGGCVAAYYLPNAWRNAEAIAQKPNTITVQELATQGISDTTRVNLKDFTCGEEFAFEMSRRRGDPPPTPDRRGYGRAWIPLFPKSSPEENPSPRRIVVLLETNSDVGTAAEFRSRNQKYSIDGLAMPLSRRALKPGIRKHLSESYPETDFENCVLLVQYLPHEIEDAPDFATLLAACTGVGLALGLPALGLGLFLKRRKKKKGNNILHSPDGSLNQSDRRGR